MWPEGFVSYIISWKIYGIQLQNRDPFAPFCTLQVQKNPKG